MTTVAKLADCIADALQVPRRAVGQYVSSMRKAGLFGIGPATADYATNLLLGILASTNPKDAPDAVRRVSGMRLIDVRVRHVTSAGVSSESVIKNIMDQGALPACFLSPFGPFLSALIEDYQQGAHIGVEARPTSLTISRHRPVAVIEFSAHPNFLGGVALGEAVYAAPADGDTQGALERGEWPPDTPACLPQLEVLAVIPGSVFEALADTLNEGEERALKSQQPAESAVAGGA